MEPDADAARDAASAFGFAPSIEMTSLCSYAPVYRLRADGQDLVLKRTGYPRSSASAIANWLHALRRCEVDVVAPVAGFAPNPRELHPFDKWSWVIYPFIEGRVYSGSRGDLRASGRLLGQIHAKGADLGLDMVSLDGLPLPDQQKIMANLEICVDQLSQWRPDLVNLFEDKTTGHLDESRQSPPSRVYPLPATACSWDFKASNLVFSGKGGAILVDPDHAGRLPRVYDVACAALLFHCDLRPSPAALWSPGQWSEFYEAYCGQVAWLPEERAVWSRALTAAWLDEALWLLAHFSEGWKREGERRYLIDLATADFERFRLL